MSTSASIPRIHGLTTIGASRYHFEGKRYDNAIEGIIREAVRVDPKQAWHYALAGVIPLLKKGRRRQALYDYRSSRSGLVPENEFAQG